MQVYRSFILRGNDSGPLPRPPEGPLAAGLGCQRLENTALPFRLNSVPERAHVGLLFVHGHHVHVTPALVADDSCVHGCLADARGICVDVGSKHRSPVGRLVFAARRTTDSWAVSCWLFKRAQLSNGGVAVQILHCEEKQGGKGQVPACLGLRLRGCEMGH